jgi:hypothetical protein
VVTQTDPQASDSPARTSTASPMAVLRAMVLAWLVPGAGHFILGRRGRALIFFAVVSVSFMVGWSLDGNLYRALPGQPLSLLGMIACMGVGAPYFLLRNGLGYEGLIDSPGYEYGTAFLLTAGLMNLLLVLDVWDIVRGRKA